MALAYFRQLYSLDTLDTRFVVPATSPPKEALQEAKADPVNPYPTSNGKHKAGEHVQPPRWRTNEFYFYYLSISASIFFMFKLVIDCSKGPSTALFMHACADTSEESHPNYSKFSHLLSDGWIPGRKVVSTFFSHPGLADEERTIPTPSTQAFDRMSHISL